MAKRTLMLLGLLGLVATLAAVPAYGVATPISPPPGAVVTTSHPVFTWSLPPNEESDGAYIASSPQTTPEGRFYDENIVDSDVFFSGETQWSPTSPLPAGAYWWLVWSHDRDTYDSFFSAPGSFSIPPSVKIFSLRVQRLTGLRLLDIYVTWTSNTDQATVSARLLKGTRPVWSRTELEQYHSVGATERTNLYWYVSKRIKPGTPLRLEIAVAAKGQVARITRKVRAP